MKPFTALVALGLILASCSFPSANSCSGGHIELGMVPTVFYLICTLTSYTQAKIKYLLDLRYHMVFFARVGLILVFFC